MSDLKKFGKKLFTVSVVSMTMVWSAGLSALVPAGVAAATCTALNAGDLFKVKGNAAVYLLNANMERMYFPNAEVYNTWYKDFAGIATIEPACTDAYPSGGGVNYRPGSRLVKTVVSPTVFAVGPNNMKHKISSPEVAKALYGDNWAKLVRDLPDVFDSNFKVGAELSTAKLHDGQIVKSGSEVWYVWNGMLKKVDGTLPSQVAADARTVSAEVLASVTKDTATVTPATLVANPAQKVAGSSGSTTSTPAMGTATVALAADTPAVSTLPSATAYNKVLKINVTAGSDKDVKVTSLTVTRTGFVADTNVSGVTVWDAQGNRHGDVMTSFNSDHKVVIGFANYPILVAKGKTETITVAYNLGSTTSGTVGASIASASDVGSDATVQGSFPVAGNIMSLVDGSSSLATFTVTTTAVGGNTASGDTGNVSIGEVKEIGKFKFTQANGKNDINVTGFTLYLDGTVKDKDFINYEVVAPDNTILAKTEFASNRYVTFKFDKAYTVPKNANRTLTVRALSNDGSGNYVRVQLQNDYDMMVADAASGHGLLPTSFASGYASDGYFKMKSGSLTLAKASASKSGNISAGASDVELASFDVTAVGEDMEIRKIGVQITSSGPAVALSGNLKLVTSDGETLLTFGADTATDALYTTAGSQRSLSQYWTVKSGQTKQLKVVGNISTNATSTSYTVGVGNFYAKRMSTLDFSDNLPSSSNLGVTGNSVTVQSTNLTLTKDTTMGNKNLAPGSSGAIIGQYVAQAGSAENVRLTNVNILFTTDGTEAGSPDVVKNLELWAGTSTAAMAKVGSTVNTAATSSNSFAFDLAIAANTSRIIQVRANLDSNGTSGHAVTTQVGSFNYIGVNTNNTTSDTTTDPTGQTMTLTAANVLITAASDTTTVSSIRTPGATAVQVAKWKVEAQNEAVTLNRITFQPVGTSAAAPNGDANQFGTLYLYDASDMTKVLAETNFTPGSSNAYARFTKDAMLTIPADQSKYLVLKAVITGSGAMSPATTSAWILPTTTASNIEIARSSGGMLTNDSIDVGQTSNNTSDSNATSTFYLFHNSAPVITAGSVGTSLSLSSQAPIFKFTVTNQGERQMRMSTTTINVSVTGLIGAGSSGAGTGTLHSFKLWEANAAGGLATELSTSSLLGNVPGCLAGSNLVTVSGMGAQDCANATTSSLNVLFGQLADTNSAFDNLTIDAGGSRTFIVTANTNSILSGNKTSGTVSVNVNLDGATGFSNGNATNEANWSDGVLLYFYTPVGGSENSTPYSGSDSYDVIGETVRLTL